MARGSVGRVRLHGPAPDPEAEYRRLVAWCASQGWGVGTHAVGSAAVALAVDAAATAGTPVADLRFQIIHGYLETPAEAMARPRARASSRRSSPRSSGTTASACGPRSATAPSARTPSGAGWITAPRWRSVRTARSSHSTPAPDVAGRHSADRGRRAPPRCRRSHHLRRGVRRLYDRRRASRVRRGRPRCDRAGRVRRLGPVARRPHDGRDRRPAHSPVLRTEVAGRTVYRKDPV